MEQLVMFATPSKIKDVEWLRRSLGQGNFGPQLNVNISAERFMIEVKSVTVTPNSGKTGHLRRQHSPLARVAASSSASSAAGGRGVISLTSRPSGAQVFLDG